MYCTRTIDKEMFFKFSNCFYTCSELKFRAFKFQSAIQALFLEEIDVIEEEEDIWGYLETQLRSVFGPEWEKYGFEMGSFFHSEAEGVVDFVKKNKGSWSDSWDENSSRLLPLGLKSELEKDQKFNFLIRNDPSLGKV